MHRPKFLTITANATSQAVPLDRYTNGYAVAVTFSNSTMTATYTLQQSFLDPYAKYTSSYDVSAQWINSNDPAMVNQTTATASNFAFAPLAVRLITSNVSGGSLTLSLIPQGMDAA